MYCCYDANDKSGDSKSDFYQSKSSEAEGKNGGNRMNTTEWQQFAEQGWDDKAKDWNEKSAEMWEAGSRKQIMDFYLKHTTADDKVLDIGCAGGYSTNKLHDAGMHAEGMDISGEMIQAAKEKYPHISFQKGDVTALPYEAERFDSMLAINVLEWVKVPVMAVRELRRTLKANGRLCIGVLGPTAGPRNHAYDRLYGDKVMMNTMQPWEFEKLAVENGFRVVDGMPSTKRWSRISDKELPIQAQQALSFMWVFILEKTGR